MQYRSWVAVVLALGGIVLGASHCNGQISLVQFGPSVDGGADATADDGSSGDDGGDDGAAATACSSPRAASLGTHNAVEIADPSGKEVYKVTVPTGGVLVRIHTSEAAPDVSIASTCDGAPAKIDTHALVGGVLARGVVGGGTVYVTVDWRNGRAQQPYGLDLLAWNPAPRCAAAATWDPSTTMTGDIMTAIDVAGGCSPDAQMGTLFYEITVTDATVPWQITAQPSGTSFGLRLLASTSCGASSCAAGPEASGSPGAPVSIVVSGANTFLVGVSAPDPMLAGEFTLTAKALAQCTNEGGSCQGGTGICCSSHCEPATTKNNCGTTCGVSCPTDPNGTASCGSGGCVLTCSSGYSQCGAGATAPCSYDITSDPQHCGTSCTACPVPPNATAASCSNGTCAAVCATNYCPSGGSCVSKFTDVSNCGTCGSSCVAQKGLPPPGANWQCQGGSCVLQCPPQTCPNPYNTACVGWSNSACGPFCTQCQSWQGPCNTVTGNCGP